MLEPAATIFIAPLNHLLSQAPWARERLSPFAGKTARIRIFPFSYGFTVTADGLVQPMSGSHVADTTISLTPGTTLRFFAGDEKAQHEMAIDGDTTFASVITYLFQHLRWDFEEDLSKVFGDVVAHRVGESARGLNAWLVEATNNLAENFRDYWVQEKPVVISRGTFTQFAEEVIRLRDDVERLEKRLAKLKGIQ